MSEPEDQPVPGARTFAADAAAYDLFMGRYSQPLAHKLMEGLEFAPGVRLLDVGCGPGALTAELLRAAPEAVVQACDPSPDFVAECARLNPGVQVIVARAEELPYADNSVDHVFSSLVLHFVSDPPVAMAQMLRVCAPGGRLTVAVWARDDGPQMIRDFSAAVDDAAGSGTSAASGVGAFLLGGVGELATLLQDAGWDQVDEGSAEVASDYRDFDELWSGFLAGVGPPGAYTVGLTDDGRERLRSALFERMGSPAGAFRLSATSRVARATKLSAADAR